jgi:hypothetical protein
VDENAYLNFDLRIEPWQAGYRARVEGSPVGPGAIAQFTFDADAAAASQWEEPNELRSFGGRLYAAVFGGQVGAHLRMSQHEARQQNAKGLRIRLLLADAPELSSLPWEYLYDPAADTFFCLSTESPIVRYFDLPHTVQPLPIALPLRVLVVISSPVDRMALDGDAEWDKLNQALGGLVDKGLVAVERIEAATLRVIQRRLRQGEYHVFHFVGHGGFDPGAEDGVLLLEDEDGLAHPVGSERLGMLLRDERTLRLVLLNACEGARGATDNPFAGVAQGLVRKGVPAVIAMQRVISDRAGMTFATGFYAALADGYPVDAALTEARKAIYVEGNETEWGTPVFYMRLPDGRVFDIPLSGRGQPSGEAAPDGDDLPETAGRAVSAAPTPARPAYAGRARPARGGDSIGYTGLNSAATLGCLVADRKDHSLMYVLCDFSGIYAQGAVPRAGDLILQPGPADGGDPEKDAIAEVARWTDSATISRILKMEDVSPQVHVRGYLQGIRAAAPGMVVYAVGRTGGVVDGSVIRVDPAQGGVIECTPMLQAGDSGAILVDAENYVLGLGFAIQPQRGTSLFLPIQGVLDALEIDLVTKEVWQAITTPQADRGQAVGGAALRRYEREFLELGRQLERGRVVLFVGADLPESVTGLPGRQALADALAARESIVPGGTLHEVAQEAMGSQSRWGITDFLREQLDTVSKAPQSFHRAIVSLAGTYHLETLVTTGYDDLLEQAFREAGLGLDVVVREDDLRFARSDHMLIQLYGHWRQADTLVVTAQDQSVLLRGRLKQGLVDEFRRALRRNSILFLGQDPGDPVINALFDELVGDFQIRSYAVWSGLSSGQIEFLESKRHLTILDVDPVALAEALISRGG